MAGNRQGAWFVVLIAVATLGVTRRANAAEDVRLIDAIRAYDHAAVVALLKQKVDVNGTAPDGSTALHWAAHNNDLEIADSLVRAGARVDVATRLGVTPLWLASENGSAPMIER